MFQASMFNAVQCESIQERELHITSSSDMYIHDIRRGGDLGWFMRGAR